MLLSDGLKGICLLSLMPMMLFTPLPQAQRTCSLMSCSSVLTVKKMAGLSCIGKNSKADFNSVALYMEEEKVTFLLALRQDSPMLLDTMVTPTPMSTFQVQSQMSKFDSPLVKQIPPKSPATMLCLRSSMQICMTCSLKLTKAHLVFHVEEKFVIPHLV